MVVISCSHYKCMVTQNAQRRLVHDIKARQPRGRCEYINAIQEKSKLKRKSTYFTKASCISSRYDLPNSLQRVETSLFADDSSLYKGGRSIKLLQTAVQQDLDALQQWCDKRGFKISTEKTVAVLFSQATQRPDIKPHINRMPINLFATRPFAAKGFQTIAPYQTLRAEGLRGSFNQLQKHHGMHWKCI